ncbi:MAG: hypothetical protein RMK89_12065, partial [Armatimonadota bacterium]|nr:hypothetical protein [Armatimonadota bacterium]MDW8144184.1 hypothetical protein [Armatimonadota bacterium]
MTPTQEDWRQIVRRLEAVEKLAMELLQRLQRIEAQLSIKPVKRELTTKERVELPEPKMPTKLTQVPVKPEEPAKPPEPVLPEKPKLSVKPEELEKPPATFPPEKPKPSVKPEEQTRQRYVPQLERLRLSVKPSPETERPSPPKPATEEKPPTAPQLEPSQSTFELEMLLGGKLALWVRATLVLLAVSFGIAYSWQFLGPTGRVLIGALAGLTFIAIGELVKGRTAKWFVEGVTALGLSLLYLTIWA